MNIQGLQETIIEWAPRLGYASILLFLGWMVASITAATLRRGLNKSGLDPSLGKFLGSLVKMGLLAAIGISVLGVLGIETTSFAAVLAAAGLAVGMALQGSLGNLASGVLLLIFRPFSVGDYIACAGVEGVVDELGVFATTLKTVDNKVVVVPNGQVAGGPITNYTRADKRRVDLVFGVDYDADLKKVKAVLNEIVTKHAKILSEPAPQIAVSELADSSVNFVCRPWCLPDDYWDVYFDLMEEVKLRFDAENISIPYPHRVIVNK